MEESPKKRADSYYYKLAFKIAADFGVTIAVPALIAAYFGQKLDEKWGTYPLMLLILITIAFIFTAIFVVRKAYYYAKLYQNGPK